MSNGKRTWLMLAALLAAVSSAALASGTPGQAAATQPAALPGHIQLDGVGIGTYEQLFRVCEVTAEQRKKMAEVYAAREKDCKEAEKAQRDGQTVLSNAYASGDKQAIAKASAEYTKLAVVNGEQRSKAQADVLAVLTPKQTAEWQKYLTLKALEGTYLTIKFTDEQWNKIFEAYEKLTKGPALRPDLRLYSLRDKVLLDVLTPEQRAKHILTTRYAEMSKTCQFTEEQAAKIVQIEEERTKAAGDLRDKNAEQTARLQKYVQEAQAANDPEALANAQQKLADLTAPVFELNRKFSDKVLTVLTDKQKSAWEAHFKDRRSGPGWSVQTKPAS